MELRMRSWDALDPVVLRPVGDISNAFIQVGELDYRAASRFVSRVAYGRNTNVSDPLVVIHEDRGTCSTKHALLRRLAAEQGLDIALVLGIYEMHERNTPGVGPVLKKYQLASLPEAHCYLRFRGNRVDVTRENQHSPSGGDCALSTRGRHRSRTNWELQEDFPPELFGAMDG